LVIPVLLLRRGALVKTRAFRHPTYIGDPINAVRILNELKADELVFLDTLASRENRPVSIDFVKRVGDEANMPFAVGGGIRSTEQVRRLLTAGAEKVVINSQAAMLPEFVNEASAEFGASTITVCIDVKRTWVGRLCTWTHGGTRKTRYSPETFARVMEERGAGELIVQSIDRDGGMQGYDIQLVRSISEAVRIPVVALGGAGSLEHLAAGYREGRASGLGAGSMFVFQGSQRGVLISYPRKSDLQI
jgi:cyclase